MGNTETEITEQARLAGICPAGMCPEDTNHRLFLGGKTMKKRFLAILLCLSVLLMACACAAETMEPPAVSETESKAPAPQFTLSEVNAESSTTQEPAASSETAPAESEPEETISMEESDIELEPIQPVEPIKPEEKETTLEFLRSYSTGAEGIYLDTMNDGEKETGLTAPYFYCMDENGELYYFYDFSGGVFYRASTGESIEVPRTEITQRSGTVMDVAVRNGSYYQLSYKSISATEAVYEIYLHQYTSENGLIATVQLPNSNGASLYTLKDGTVLVSANGKLYDTDGKLTSFALPQFETTESGDQFMILPDKKILLPQEFSSVNGGLEAYTLHRNQIIDTNGIWAEDWYSQFSSAGEYLSAFRIISASSKYAKCHYVTASGGVCEGYFSSDILVDSILLKGTLHHTVIQDANSVLYLLAVYPDRADLYRIDQGYTDIVFGELETEIFDDLTDPMEEASVGSSLLSAMSTNETTTIKHVPLANETVGRRADYVLHTPWRLFMQHVPPIDNEDDQIDIPNCILEEYSSLVGNTSGISLQGIPYCWGRMNGYETYSESSYKKMSFWDVLLPDEDGNYYIVGNVGKEAVVSNTVGVDCSGFVGSTCGLSSKVNCDMLSAYGHPVTASAVQMYDIIIENIDDDEAFEHCYFYIREDPENANNILVWDCTSSYRTDQKTDERSISKNVFNRSIILRPYYTFERTATHHRYYCTHPDCAGTSNAEASAWIAHVWETPDPENPSVQYCKICNFCSQHTFTYTNTSGGHMGTCSECSYVTATTPHEFEATGVAGAHFFDCSICGFSSGPIPHTFTYAYSNTVHVGTCSECGYSFSGTHNVTASPGDVGEHVYSCVCGYTATQAHTFTYTMENLAKHRQTCSKCGYSELAPHLFGYSYDADGHWQECSLCSFETVSFAHNFVDSECTVCGCPEFIIMDIIAIPEEDEPLPVPEDQKATL